MTAARECEEETGLNRRLIKHLGYLEPVLTNTNYLVDRAVGYLQDPRQLEALLQPDPAEVVRLFTLLAPLLNIDLASVLSALVRMGIAPIWQIPDRAYDLGATADARSGGQAE